MQSTAEQPNTVETGNGERAGYLEQTGWLTAREAAAYAGGLGVSTIREACNRKELRHVRIGGGATGPIRTRKEWVDDWLERWARGGPLV